MSERLAAIWTYWQAGGWLMVPLAVIVFCIWYQYLALRWRLQKALGRPLDVGALGNQTSGSDSAAARVMSHAGSRVRAGLEVSEAYQQCREAELAPYAHAFYMLGALVMAAPLVGLLGTVLGMVATFDAVGGAGDTGMVAGGISQALVTTQVGLVAALPGAFGLAHLYRLYQRLGNDLDRCGSALFLQVNKEGMG